VLFRSLRYQWDVIDLQDAVRMKGAYGGIHRVLC
jgi:hypothetical protein